MSDALIPFGAFTPKTETAFRKEVYDFCKKTSELPITSFFTEMIAVCARYRITPPDFLYYMAKPFLLLNGISVFSENMTKATDLLKKQVTEYFIKRSIDDTVGLIANTTKALIPSSEDLKSILREGVVSALANKAGTIEDLVVQARTVFANYEEAFQLLSDKGSKTFKL